MTALLGRRTLRCATSTNSQNVLHMDFCDVSTDQRAPFSPQGRSHPPSTLNPTSSTSSSFGAGQFPARQQSPLIYPRHAAPLDGRILCYANIMSCPTSPDDTVPWPPYGHRTCCMCKWPKAPRQPHAASPAAMRLLCAVRDVLATRGLTALHVRGPEEALLEMRRSPPWHEATPPHLSWLSLF